MAKFGVKWELETVLWVSRPDGNPKLGKERPAWAGPIAEVAAWETAEVAKLPEAVRRLFVDRNVRHWTPDAGNKPTGMASEAPGINPSRWDRA